MKKQIIKTNWKALHKIATEQGRVEAAKTFFSEYRPLEKKWDEFSKKYYALEMDAKKKHLKSLPIGCPVYYNASQTKQLIGKSGLKVSDGMKYMIVNFGNELKSWRLPYRMINDQPLNSDAVSNNKVSNEISAAFNKVVLST